MDNQTGMNYTQIPYKTRPTFGGVELAETLIEARIVTHDDIPMSSFASLDKIKIDMELQGFSPEEIEKNIAGLSELPEYANTRGYSKSRKRA